MAAKILIYPLARRGEGTGHVRRCLALARSISAHATVLIDDEPAVYHEEPRADRPQNEIRELDQSTYDLILVDRRQTSYDELRRLAQFGIVVGLDEGGSSRPHFPYLIDAIPAAMDDANVSSLAMLDLPRYRLVPRYPIRKAVLSFGGEDPADLSYTLLDAVLRHGIFRPDQLTVVEAAGFVRTDWPPGVTVVRRPKSVVELLAAFDIVFTSFGLTCFEALASGLPVVLLNPSRYHRALARAVGIPEIGVGRPRMNRLRALLAKTETLEKSIRWVARSREAGLPPLDRHLADLSFSGGVSCPVCSARGSSDASGDTERARFDRALARFTFRTYFRCAGCGLIYLARFDTKENPYAKSYFFEDYRKQYGKTYLEDFPAIRAVGSSRIEIIRGLLDRTERHGRRTVMDIGCAYGPFLAAARDAGFEPIGLEVVPEAARYVTDRLGFPCLNKPFETFEVSHLPDGRPAHVITMWYVIEHFFDVDTVLRRVNRSLAMEGVFAFATPNGAGISARKNLTGFLESSPHDHYTIWRPAITSRILERYGFTVRQIRITGHHPERFPGLAAGSRRSSTGVLHAIAGGVSRWCGLGDTYEVYAIKTGEAT